VDLNTINEVLRPASADAVKEWPTGHAWLAGGTWLFSEPQVTTNTQVDLEAFKWPSLALLPHGLEIAATCKAAELRGNTSTRPMPENLCSRARLVRRQERL